MKKKIIVILSLLIITFTVVKLYQTFATESLVNSDENVYNISLTDNSSITVPANSSKIIIYQICNTNKGKVNYGVGYTSTSSNYDVKEWYDSIDPSSGIIDYGENKFVKLKLINRDAEDAVFTISTILGYEYGGDLIVPTTTSLVTKKVNEKNYLKSITSSLTKTQIS